MRRYATLTSLAILAWSCEPSRAQPPSNVTFIHADAVHAQNISGLGVTVAVIDTGVDYVEPGLGGDIAAGGAGFDSNGRSTGIPGTDIWNTGHGTLVSLVITDATGVAPNAKILPVRVSVDGYNIPPQDIASGIRYVSMRRKADPTIRVINISLGTGSYQCLCDQDSGYTRWLDRHGEPGH